MSILLCFLILIIAGVVERAIARQKVIEEKIDDLLEQNTKYISNGEYDPNWLRSQTEHQAIMLHTSNVVPPKPVKIETSHHDKTDNSVSFVPTFIFLGLMAVVACILICLV